MKKTFKDLKPGDKVWLYYYDLNGDSVREITYNGKITTKPCNDKIIDFDTKDYPGWVWYGFDDRPNPDTTMLCRTCTIIYFNETDAIEHLEKRMAGRWLAAHTEYNRVEQYMDSYFKGDEKAIMQFKTKVLQDEAKRVREDAIKYRGVDEKD